MHLDAHCRCLAALCGLLPALGLSTNCGDEPPRRTPQLQSNAPAERRPEQPNRAAAFLRAQFEGEFAAARGMSAEQRLVHAAEVTATLRANAEAAPAELLDAAGIAASPRARLFPRREDVARLLAARPWLRVYWGRGDDRQALVATVDYVWPTAADVAALAREALATLQVPEDVLRLAGALGKRLPVVDICLLTAHPHAGGADVTGPTDRFVELPIQLRLTPQRLVALIRREQLWPDVDWRTPGGGWNTELSNRKVERIALSAEWLLRPANAADLRGLLDSQRESLWWSGQTALILGISRLLPPAADPQELEIVATREGLLRHAARTEREEFVRGYVAQELVRLDAARHASLRQVRALAQQRRQSQPTL